MCASLSQTTLPKVLGTNTKCYNMVVDFLSEMTVGDVFVETDLDGLLQSQSLIKNVLNNLTAKNIVSIIQVLSCSDCSCLIENDTICLSCGLDNTIEYDPEKLQGFKLTTNISRSPDSFWPVDSNFFNMQVCVHYSDGLILYVQGRLDGNEILLHSSAIKNGLYPQWFKIDDCTFDMVSDQLFLPKFGNRKRHYKYSIKLKESATMKNIVNNYGTIGTLNQSIEKANITDNEASKEIISIINLILKNMDPDAASFLQHRQQLQKIQDEKSFFDKTSDVMNLLSSVVTIASFDLSSTLDKLNRLIKL